MAIRDWHPGQLGVLWVGGAGVAWMCSWIVQHQKSGRAGEGGLFIASIGLLAIPVALLIITWKWFGSRNRPREP